MNKENISAIMNSLIPKLTAFAYVLSGDEKRSIELVTDSYTTFLLQNNKQIQEMGIENSKVTPQQRVAFKKFFLHQLLHEMFELSSKRKEYAFSSTEQQELEYKAFFELSRFNRSVLFLKEILEMDVQSIQEVYILQRHHIIEALYNAKSSLLRDMKSLSIYSSEFNELDKSKLNLINASVGGTLRNKDSVGVLELVNSEPLYKEYYQMKLAEKDFLNQLIVNKKFTINTFSSLREELSLIHANIIPADNQSLLSKAINYLNSPLVS